MHYVYISKSKISDQLYIGYTQNIVKRLNEHNAGESYHTKKYMPWELVYFEGYADGAEAQNREKKIKQFGKVYSQLKRRIRRSITGPQKVRG